MEVINMGMINKFIDFYRVISKPEKNTIKTKENVFDEIANHQYKETDIDLGKDTFLCNNEIINFFAIYGRIFRESKIKTFAGVMEVDILTVDKLSNANTPYIERKTLDDFSKTLDENGRIRFSSYNDFKNNGTYLEKRAHFWDENCWDVYIQKWNNKICIHNVDGAHHLAALYRQSYNQNLRYYLKSKVYFENIDYVYLKNVLDDYYIFYSERENVRFVQQCYRNFYNDMNSEDIIYYNKWGITEPVLLLKKNDAFNEKVTNYFYSNEKEFISMNEIIDQAYLKKTI